MKFDADDIAAFLDAVGEAATITEPGAAGPPVVAAVVTPLIVDYSSTSLNEMGMLTDRPVATMSGSTLAGKNLKTATITVDGTTWRMTNPMYDESGFVSVYLTRI